MDSNQKKYDEITEQLSQFPSFTDRRDKEAIRQQIFAKMKQNEPTKQYKPRKRWIPLVSTLLATTVLVFISFLYYTNTNVLKENSTQQDAMEYATEEETLIEKSADQENSAQPNGHMESSNQMGMFVQQTNEQSMVIHGATSDPQLQFVIPVSFIAPEGKSKETYYNQLETYLQEYVPVSSNYLFKGVSFKLDEGNKELILELPKNFSISEGSTVPNMFEDQLRSMFSPYGIETAVFNNQEGIDFGQFGTIHELALTKTKTAYKLYSDEQNNLLVEVPLDEYTTIEEALAEMQIGEEDYNVFPTVPGEIEFSIVTRGEQLDISLDNEVAIEDSRTGTIMVEAILMTAKSFGYDLVKVNNISGDRVGYYDVSEPLRVPDAVNPIKLH